MANSKLEMRKVRGTQGQELLVVDEFPEQMTVSDSFLKACDPKRVYYNEEKGRLWVNADNGCSEYLVTRKPYALELECLRYYQDLRWTPEPLPKAATPAKAVSPSGPEYVDEYED